MRRPARAGSPRVVPARARRHEPVDLGPPDRLELAAPRLDSGVRSQSATGDRARRPEVPKHWVLATTAPVARDASASSATSRVLPTPASPRTSARRGRPPEAVRHRSRRTLELRGAADEVAGREPGPPGRVFRRGVGGRAGAGQQPVEGACGWPGPARRRARAPGPTRTDGRCCTAPARSPRSPCRSISVRYPSSSNGRSRSRRRAASTAPVRSPARARVSPSRSISSTHWRSSSVRASTTQSSSRPGRSSPP